MTSIDNIMLQYSKKAKKFKEELDLFNIPCDKRDFKNKYLRVKKAWEKRTSDFTTALAALLKLLNDAGIQYDENRKNDIEYLKNLIIGEINRKNSKISTLSNVTKKLLYTAFINYKNYASPEDYLTRIVKHNRSEDDHWANDTLRVQILKQFIKYGNCLTYKSNYSNKNITLYGGKNYIKSYLMKKIDAKNISNINNYLKYINDDIFDILQNAKRDQKKPKGIYGLIKLVDDLSSGKFHSEGSTKKGLYYFAIVYNMTYGNNFDTAQRDYREIEENLFHDYYANNLIRFITDPYKNAVNNAYERDPSGQAINYKNFVEAILLYFISKDINPQEKIKKSSEMINRVKEKARNNNNNNEEIIKQQTSFYKNQFDNELINLSEEEFEQFILSHYNCVPQRGIGDFSVEADQRSAYRQYRIIINKLKEQLKKNNDEEEADLSVCNYGLWFIDAGLFEKDSNELEKLYQIFKVVQNDNDIEITDFNKNDVKDFILLLKEMNTFLSNKSMLSIEDPKYVTRTAIIIAYYYYFNALHLYQEDQMGFKELYEEFKNDINRYLDEAYFQRINPKNIFDILIILSSYAYMYDLMLDKEILE